MLVLNDVAANDNLAVFVMELYAEGNNLVSNSRFDSSSSTGWTLNGDWLCQNNQLEYIWVDDAGTASAQITVSATTSGATYVLEYEVTALSGTFTFECEGDQGANIITGDLTIPQTLGKHSVRIVGDGGTVLGFKLVDATDAGDYIHIDNIKLRKEEDVIRISTRDISLTDGAGSIDFDGQVMSFNSLSDVDGYIDAEASGGIGAITGYNFKLKRYATNTRTSDFFNEFFPAYNGGQIVARKILFGVVWNSGTPAYTDITWLMRGKVIIYEYEPRAIYIMVLQSTEIEPVKEAPYYIIQKDFNNFVSYFTNAPDENYGVTIPIVYGIHDVGTSLAAGDAVAGLVTYSPGIIIDYEKNSILIASHKCESIAAVSTLSAYKFIAGLNSYMGLTSGSDATVNNYLNSYYSVTDTNDDIIGSMIIPLKAQSSYSGVGSLFNVIDNDTTNYKTLVDATTGGGTTNRLALSVGGSASTTEVGWLSVTDSQVVLTWRIASDDAGNRDYTLGVNNLAYGSPPNLDTVTTGTITSGASPTEKTHSFGASTDMKKDAIIPWTIEEVCDLEYYIINDDTTAGDDIRVYYVTLKLSNIKVSGIGRQYTVGRMMTNQEFQQKYPGIDIYGNSGKG